MMTELHYLHNDQSAYQNRPDLKLGQSLMALMQQTLQIANYRMYKLIILE